MSAFAIRANALGKRYWMSADPRAPYGSLRDTLMRLPGRIAGRMRVSGREETRRRPFWALKDLSFDIGHGEVVGVIGRNGAGKSTLLKILSRITEPTCGYADVTGRIGSLLEVGTGFHPELSGRENIFLNGAILGMSRADVRRKLDAIVDFSEVADFLDTPVKHYSSGMFMRLAFSVAAHLEPDILLVDEVLAVGDMAFQKKCLGKMGEEARMGRTVLFVSHDMQAVTQLTTRCIVLSSGCVLFDGPTPEAIQTYRQSILNERDRGPIYRAPDDTASNHVRSARVLTFDGSGTQRSCERTTFEFQIAVQQLSESLCFSFQIVNAEQLPISTLWMFDSDRFALPAPGLVTLRCVVPRLRLYQGSYTLTTWLSDRRGRVIQESLQGICPFEVTLEGMPREQWEWQPGEAQYLEDFHWDIQHEPASTPPST